MASQGAAQRAFVPVRRLRVHRDEQRLHLRLETYEPIDGQSIVVEIWPGADMSRGPWNTLVPGAQPPDGGDALMRRQGTHDFSLSIPITQLGIAGLRNIALRVGLVQRDSETCWVPAESPAVLILDSGQA